MRYFAHKSTCIDEDVEIGDGTQIWHYTHISRGAKIGKHVMIGQGCFVGKNVVIGYMCRIQNNVSVYEGVVLDRCVFVGPSVVFTNVRRPVVGYNQEKQPIIVQRGASIGANATIVAPATIGEFAFIGAGAVVIGDVPARVTVAGNPAVPII